MAYTHPMAQNPYRRSQHMGFLSDLKSWGQETIDKTINAPVEKFLTNTVGLTPEEVKKIQSEATKEIQKTSQNELNQLIAQVTGQKPPTTAPSTIAQMQSQITGVGKKIYDELMKGNPVYLAGAAAVGGLALYALYGVIAGPEQRQEEKSSPATA